MADQFLGEIRMMSFSFAPRGWAQCSGQLLAIQQNQALFALFGTTYGGNGVNTFALPNFMGRIPMHVGNGFVQGQVGGEEHHTLTQSEMPPHAHIVTASNTAATLNSPSGAVWAKGTKTEYAAAGNAAMHPGAIGSTGSTQPHPNLPPYLTINFCVAIQGIFPSRN